MMMCSRHKSSSKMLFIDSSIDFLSFPFLLLYMQMDGNDSPLPPLFKKQCCARSVPMLSSPLLPQYNFTFFTPKQCPNAGHALIPFLAFTGTKPCSDEITHLVMGTGGKVPSGRGFLKKSMKSQQHVGQTHSTTLMGEKLRGSCRKPISSNWQQIPSAVLVAKCK